MSKSAGPSISEEEMYLIRLRIRKLSNRTKFDEIRAYCLAMMKKHPDMIEFRFMEAVFSAEDDTGYTPKQIAIRHAKAAQKIRKLFPKIRTLPKNIRAKMRNEYYWFSHQPKKQYLLGLEMVKKGVKSSYYSQGVGAAEVARNYALKKQRGHCLRWAKLSEKAWKSFHKHWPDWFNSYFFLAQALGYQGRIEDMDIALAKAARYAGKPKSWQACKQMRNEIMSTVAVMNGARGKAL